MAKSLLQTNKNQKKRKKDIPEEPHFDAAGNEIKTFGEKVRDKLHDNAGVLAGGAAGAMLNSGMNYKDMMKLAATAFIVYKMYQGHVKRKEFFGNVADKTKELVGKGIDYAKDKIEERNALREELQLQENEHLALVDKIKNPNGMYSDSYRVNDVLQNLAEKFPYSSTEAYQSMSKKDQRDYDKFQSEEALHRARYHNAFAEKGYSMEDCCFYDIDGKRLDVFGSFDKEQVDENLYADVGRHLVAKEALIYGFDKGQIKCILPNGEEFNPGEIPSIKNDYYSKHFDEMQKKSSKFAEKQAAMDSEVVDKLVAMSDYDVDTFVPGMNKSETSSFVYETSVYANVHAKASNEVLFLRQAGRNPNETFLTEIAGARIASDAEMKERKEAEFREAHPVAGKMKDAASTVADKTKEAAVAVAGKTKETFETVKTAAEQRATEKREAQQRAIAEARRAGEKLMNVDEFEIPLSAQALGPEV